MRSEGALTPGQIIRHLTPVVEELRQVRYGWALAILGLIVLNFPPLMGSELLMVACGVVWGVKGGLIVAVGTVLGEMANFTCVPLNLAAV